MPIDGVDLMRMTFDEVVALFRQLGASETAAHQIAAAELGIPFGDVVFSLDELAIRARLRQQHDQRVLQERRQQR